MTMSNSGAVTLGDVADLRMIEIANVR